MFVHHPDAERCPNFDPLCVAQTNLTQARSQATSLKHALDNHVAAAEKMKREHEVQINAEREQAARVHLEQLGTIRGLLATRDALLSQIRDLRADRLAQTRRADEAVAALATYKSKAALAALHYTIEVDTSGARQSLADLQASVEQVRAAQVEASEAVAAVQKAHAANVTAIKAHGSLIG